jgi:hypothetical protein
VEVAGGAGGEAGADFHPRHCSLGIHLIALIGRPIALHAAPDEL